MRKSELKVKFVCSMFRWTEYQLMLNRLPVKVIIKLYYGDLYVMADYD